MILSDRDIRRALAMGQPGKRWAKRNRGPSLAIWPVPADDCFQPASVELTLAVDGKQMTVNGPISSSRAQFTVEPDDFWLFSTRETVTLSAGIAARVEGKSSLARQGLAVHITGGFIDPGFSGQITLEVKNLGPLPVTLRAGQKICQLSFHTLSTPALRPYGHPELDSHYQGQSGPTEAR